MKKNAKRNVQPQPIETIDTGATGGMAAEVAIVSQAMEANNVSRLPITKGGSRKSLAADYKASLMSNVAEKVTLMGDVRQKLAEAADTYKQGSGEMEHAREIAGNAIVRLYQGQRDGLLTKDETSATLGDTFGYKAKKDDTPGKTPAGEGEAIRKRVVRLVSAHAFIDGGDGGTFFNGLSGATDDDGNTAEDAITAILLAVDGGQTSPWAAYDQLAAVKRDFTTRVEAAFDPAKIAKLASALAEPKAVEQYRNNPALVAAYSALNDVWQIVDEAAANMVAEAATA